jgi:hypothetical protein
MSKSKKLSKRQLAVIEDLFVGKLEEQEVLEKHNVRPREYQRWLADEGFTGQLEQWIARACRESRMILARNASEAAKKLVELTKCDKGEVARKACLDIIAPPGAGQNPRADAASDRTPPVPVACGLTPEMAGRLLAALAREPEESCDGHGQ